MATNLDLQEQEQLDELKAFWKQYGNLITWLLIIALGGFAALNGWNYWQRDQGIKAGAMFEEFDRAVQAGDVDKAGLVFKDLKERFGRTVVAQQAGLQAAALQLSKGQIDAAQASLSWVAEQATDEDYKAMARLRLASVLIDKQAFDEALKQLDAVKAEEFKALAQDRRGDIYQAQGKLTEAVAAWQAAWTDMSDKLDYRRVVEAKLIAQGAAPAPAAAASSGGTQ